MPARRTALVTGASSGIGREFCNVLAERGWNLVLVARREDRLLRAKGELGARFAKQPVQVDVLRADLALPADRARVTDALERHSVRFLINNAGLQARGEFGRVDFARLQPLIDVNVTALAELSHAAVGHFRKLGGPCHLMNVGSVNSFIATGDSATYSGTKAFVKFLTVALAEELRDTGITCTCFCPGGTESEMLGTSGMQIKAGQEKLMMRADQVARLGIDAALAGQTLAVPGLGNRLSVLFSRLLGERAATRISTKIMRRVVVEKSG